MPKTPLSKSEQTRQRLLNAAAKVVGKVGYHKASVSKITHTAKLASGGFYYYFKTREDLFEQLLPSIGEKMIAFISDYVKGTPWGLAREARAFEGYILFLRNNPEFYRVFSEAYVYAPKAYKKHFTIVVDNYCKALRVQRAKGHIEIADDEVPALAYFLIGMRAYFSQMYMEKIYRGDLAEILDLYNRMLDGRVFGAERASTPSAPAPPAVSTTLQPAEVAAAPKKRRVRAS